jgi:formate dehydrogenase maturation protein FdhE
MTFERPRGSWGSRDDDGAVKPAHCPECGSKKFGTLAAIITRDTYWRCAQCATVWNEIRYRQQHKRQW